MANFQIKSPHFNGPGEGDGGGGAETMIMSENITYNSTAIDCFFEYFNAQIQNALFTTVITFPDDKIMLN